jgi:hypothetical protein
MTEITSIKQNGYRQTITTNNNVIIYRNTTDGCCVPQRISKLVSKGVFDSEYTQEEREAVSYVVLAFKRTLQWQNNGNTYIYLAFNNDLEMQDNNAENVYKVC